MNFDDTATNTFLVVRVVLYIDLKDLASDITQCNAFSPGNNIYSTNTQGERKFTCWLGHFIEK